MIPCCAICFLVTVFLVKGQKTLSREDDERLQAEGRAWAAQNRVFRMSNKRQEQDLTQAVELGELNRVGVSVASGIKE